MLAVTGMVTGADAGFVVNIPGKDRRVLPKTAGALMHQLITLLAIGGMIDTGALPAVIIVIGGTEPTLPIHYLGIGVFVDKAVMDIKGGKAKEDANAQLLADVQQATHFVQLAVKANPNADRIETGLFDHG